MMCNRKVLSEKRSVFIYRYTAVHTLSVLSNLINGLATYYVSPLAAAAQQHLVNLNVYINSYRIRHKRIHSGLYRVPGNNLSQRTQPTTPSAASSSTISKRIRLNTAVRTPSKRHVRHSLHTSSSSWRNLVILIKTFCFLMLFAGVTALPPVIRIGKYRFLGTSLYLRVRGAVEIKLSTSTYIRSLSESHVKPHRHEPQQSLYGGLNTLNIIFQKPTSLCSRNRFSCNGNVQRECIYDFRYRQNDVRVMNGSDDGVCPC